ncbi:hypothetical protein H2509_07135 [Stappia sp. F7233]|uniref:Uncharacterized protein n=1 Tax=Stappia albiluteola TaxID=2758565 RepID=A0A839ADB7_9HYPH|nr:hypothetical protein [Stappia albiluteola]MBA5776902.1 hypothetical protein [Stappia albiluteola]
MTVLANFAGLATTAGLFAVVVLAFLGLASLYRSGRMPRILSGDVTSMILCALLTAAFAGTLIGVFASALRLPFHFWGDLASAVAVLLAVTLLGLGASRLLGHRGNPSR